MNKLMVVLPSGSQRYITGFKDKDFSHSIYPTNCIDASETNINQALQIIEELGVECGLSYAPLDNICLGCKDKSNSMLRGL